jgi:hypothetical protein
MPAASKDDTLGRRCGAEPDAGAGPDSATDAPPDAPDDAASADGGSAVWCSGLCVDLGDAASVCSHRCVFGDTAECAPVSGAARRGGCLYVTPGGTVGDLGYCAEVCDCNDQCSEPTSVCDAFGDATLEAAFGRKGVCTAPELALKGPIVCNP